MPRLEIPETLMSEMLSLFRSATGLNAVVAGCEDAAALLEQFIENNTPLPCPYCQCTESSEYIILAIPGYKCRRCDNCGACGPSVEYIDEAEMSRSITEEWNNHGGKSGACLWCGRNEPEEFEIAEIVDSKHYIWCNWCQASGPEAETPERAMKLWRQID
jgi:hypothetical protein